MRARYGLDRRPVGRWIAVGVIVVAFAAILGFVAMGVTSNPTATRLLSWKVVDADHVTITFQVEPDANATVTCLLRAQDAHRIDLGYATTTVPPTPDQDMVLRTYQLRTLAPAYTAELLGCEAGKTPRVPGPQFPPGVVAPDQPWTSGS
jgi:hypothetical protein